jgi:Etoposide-induced protein 2.4 (EI24)
VIALADSAWRAGTYCLHPKVMLAALVPLLLMVGAVWGLGFFFWENAVSSLRDTLLRWDLLQPLLDRLDRLGLAALRSVVAPLLVVALALPVLVMASLLLVAGLATPVVVRMVAARRFPALARTPGATALQALAGSAGQAALAAVALAVSLPLWLWPPLALLLPALVWAWLAERVLASAVLAQHASRDERQALLRRHRGALRSMGLACGVLLALPSLLWATGAAAFILAPLLAGVSVWLYVLLSVYASAWFAHYLLAALHALRASVPIKASLPDSA